MSKLMSVLGIILLAIGAALALVGFINPAQMQIHGLTLDTAAILLTGGVLAIGLGGVIAALSGYAPAATVVPAAEVVEEPAPVIERPVFKAEAPAAPVVEGPAPAAESPARIRFPGFGKRTAEVAATAAAVTAVATQPAAAIPAKSAVDDTIAALDQAKADIANAIGGMSNVTEPPADDEVTDEESAAEDDDEPGDGELYVIEEREIRGRPARILSDQTVEAETDEGWMRFENLEHLNEYLDSMGEPA